jgi:D-alanyl-D-alanine carboxypeptidase/Putative peptidoglycan binding domain
VGISLNGWAAPPARLATGTVPGTKKKVTLQADVLPLFLALLADIHKTVVAIDVPGALGPDGYELRDARASSGISNHGSGTAVDVRYDLMKADRKKHLTDAQTAACHKLLDKYVDANGRRIFGWGGDWKLGTYMDEMHWEIAQSWAVGAHGRKTTMQDVKNVIARLKIQPDGTVQGLAVVPAKPVTTPVAQKPVLVKAIPPFLGTMKIGFQGDQVKAIQIGLGIPADGKFGPVTALAVKKYQRVHPTLWPADGVVGPRTYKMLARAV